MKRGEGAGGEGGDLAWCVGGSETSAKAEVAGEPLGLTRSEAAKKGNLGVGGSAGTGLPSREGVLVSAFAGRRGLTSTGLATENASTTTGAAVIGAPVMNTRRRVKPHP